MDNETTDSVLLLRDAVYYRVLISYQLVEKSYCLFKSRLAIQTAVKCISASV